MSSPCCHLPQFPAIQGNFCNHQIIFTWPFETQVRPGSGPGYFCLKDSSFKYQVCLQHIIPILPQSSLIQTGSPSPSILMQFPTPSPSILFLYFGLNSTYQCPKSLHLCICVHVLAYLCALECSSLMTNSDLFMALSQAPHTVPDPIFISLLSHAVRHLQNLEHNEAFPT